MPNRISCRLTAACFALAMATMTLAAPQGGWLRAEPAPATGSVPYSRPPGPLKTEEGGKRLREGTRLIDAEGRFDSNGERWIFFPADSAETYKVLENLALERIHKVMEETRASEKPRWIISATVTEYMGSNHLLVTKAVIKVQAAGSSPAYSDNRAAPREAAETAPENVTKAGQRP